MPLPEKITARYQRVQIAIISTYAAAFIGLRRAQKKYWRSIVQQSRLFDVLEDCFVCEAENRALILKTDFNAAVGTRALVINREGLVPPEYATRQAQCELDLQLQEAQVSLVSNPKWGGGKEDMIAHGLKRLIVAQRQVGYMKIVTRTLEQKFGAQVASHVASFLGKIAMFSICPSPERLAIAQREFMFVSLLQRTLGIAASIAEKITEDFEVDDFRFF